MFFISLVLLYQNGVCVFELKGGLGVALLSCPPDRDYNIMLPYSSLISPTEVVVNSLLYH